MANTQNVVNNTTTNNAQVQTQSQLTLDDLIEQLKQLQSYTLANTATIEELSAKVKANEVNVEKLRCDTKDSLRFLVDRMETNLKKITGHFDGRVREIEMRDYKDKIRKELLEELKEKKEVTLLISQQKEEAKLPKTATESGIFDNFFNFGSSRRGGLF